MATEVVSVLLLGIGWWLLDPMPWIVIAMTIVLLRRWPRWAFFVAIVLGTAAGLAVMCCINGCSYPGHASFGIAAFWAVSDAIIEVFVVAGLFKLVRRFRRPPK